MKVHDGAGLARVIALVDSYPVQATVMVLLLMALVVAWWALFRLPRIGQRESGMAENGSGWFLLLVCSMLGFAMMSLAFCYAMGFSVASSALVAVMTSFVLMSPVPWWRRRNRRRGDDARAKT